MYFIRMLLLFVLCQTTPDLFASYSTTKTTGYPLTNTTGQTVTVLLDYPDKNTFDVFEVANNNSINLFFNIKALIVFPQGLPASIDGSTWAKNKRFPSINEAPRVVLTHVIGSDDDVDVYVGDYPTIVDEMKKGFEQVVKVFRLVNILTGYKDINSIGLWRSNQQMSDLGREEIIQ